MGLPAEIYDFPNSAPSFEEICQAVEGMETARVSMQVLRPVEAPQRPLTAEERAHINELLAKRQSKTANEPRSISFAPEFLRLSKGRDRLSIRRSSDGQKIIVLGDHCGADLFKSACTAIQRLGGSLSP
jgi:hypothetical protein